MATAPANLPLPNPEEYSEELARARMLAERYRLDFIDMEEFRSIRICSDRSQPTSCCGTGSCLIVAKAGSS
jgi:hypothetical protein